MWVQKYGALSIKYPNLYNISTDNKVLTFPYFYLGVLSFTHLLVLENFHILLFQYSLFKF